MTVSPLDELRVLYRYAGSTNVVRLYNRMEELAEELGYGREYWRAVKDADERDAAGIAPQHAPDDADRGAAPSSKKGQRGA